jgi:hypothetical protein
MHHNWVLSTAEKGRLPKNGLLVSESPQGAARGRRRGYLRDGDLWTNEVSSPGKRAEELLALDPYNGSGSVHRKCRAHTGETRGFAFALTSEQH